MTAVDTLRSKVRSANAEQISLALYFCLKELGAEGQQAAQVEDIRAAWGIPAAEEAENDVGIRKRTERERKVPPGDSRQWSFRSKGGQLQR